MKKLNHFLLFSLLTIFFTCCEEGDDGHFKSTDGDSGDGFELATEGYTDGIGEGGGNGGDDQSGLITAGEWNDLNNWNFWNDLMDKEGYDEAPDYWGFYTNNRVAVQLTSNGTPLANVKVELLKNNIAIWATKTDNLGNAELWMSLFLEDNQINITDYSIRVNNSIIETNISTIQNGINEISVVLPSEQSKRVELSFIVDATGSMSDELEFLKDDLENVIASVKSQNALIDVFTSTVFYRDESDEYVVRKSAFTNNLYTTTQFIDNQSAGGGGDYPEAVHSALNACINDLKWSEQAKTRIAFLLLDAPPHYESEIVKNIQDISKIAAEKGIKIIPITASGVDKNTEFLMRFIAMATNGIYVFITNHSGIGDEHLEASVGEYEVEYLKDLMIRLIQKYSE